MQVAWWWVVFLHDLMHYFLSTNLDHSQILTPSKGVMISDLHVFSDWLKSSLRGGAILDLKMPLKDQRKIRNNRKMNILGK